MRMTMGMKMKMNKYESEYRDGLAWSLELGFGGALSG